MSSAVAKRLRDASCLYSFNTKRRAQSFIISCFGFRYSIVNQVPRTIKFCSVLFSSAYSSMLQTVTNKYSLVRRRLCDFVVSTVENCWISGPHSSIGCAMTKIRMTHFVFSAQTQYRSLSFLQIIMSRQLLTARPCCGCLKSLT